MINNDLSPPQVNVIIPQGSDVYEFFTFYSDELQTQPLDLTGFSAETQVRLTSDSPSVILKLLSSTGDIIIGAVETNGIISTGDPVNGSIAIKYQSSVTSLIKFKGDSFEGFRALEITDATGRIKRVLDGTFTLTKEIVR